MSRASIRRVAGRITRPHIAVRWLAGTVALLILIWLSISILPNVAGWIARRPAAAWTAVAAALVILVCLSIAVLPRRLVPNVDPTLEFPTVTDRAKAQTDRLSAQNGARTALLQGIAGLGLFVTAFFAWQQANIAREGQITERFTRAIEQLGDKDKRLDVQLGGLYALERIAKDSQNDRATIAEVLTAYVRGHAPRASNKNPEQALPSPQEPRPDLPFEERAPDVQAVMSVLIRHPFFADSGTIDLREVDLALADLGRANLQGADLDGANLQDADLYGANLQDADLYGANLQRAFLVDANLQRAFLVGANLEGAQLESANLSGANLVDANLEGAGLVFANVEGAVSSSATIWPAGFDPAARGVIVTELRPEP